jgi:hypothetical protein
MTAGWLWTGARTVISEVHATGMTGWYIDQLFTTQQTINKLLSCQAAINRTFAPSSRSR